MFDFTLIAQYAGLVAALGAIWTIASGYFGLKQDLQRSTDKVNVQETRISVLEKEQSASRENINALQHDMALSKQDTLYTKEMMKDIKARLEQIYNFITNR